ncbi:RtcB family protein [Bartonella sp. HY761]|uniref:RtcB family protein n=1 Tax=Bartonella sp. HY761 TaxID=2979330 RepID=UPI0021FA5321|nr:RtcB family protein [Bartonella sp. HY761]UXN06030.1 RtcB family protein [Bartonella sp. HY761]
MTNKLFGTDLIEAGQQSGKWFAKALEVGNAILQEGGTREQALAAAIAFAPPPTIGLQDASDVPLHINIRAENDFEQENIDKVIASMKSLIETPVVKAAAIMPDACPTGSSGEIPVGGIVASEAIHPGMHSADICCSLAISVFKGVAPADLLNAVHKVTHFGPGGRERGNQIRPSDKVMQNFADNIYLEKQQSVAIEHFATQGDGNHFAYVGQLKSTGETVLVTHHGSRAPGARLYKTGMKVADRFRKELSPKTQIINAWIPADSVEGETYWSALQIIRQWTKENHFAIHDLAADVLGVKVNDRFWNEHNFVFRKSDGLFYHAKGATPAFSGWSHDATDLTIIPLNMAEPILIVRGSNADHGLGFSPHGAGRNFSRSGHVRNLCAEFNVDKNSLGDQHFKEIIARETKGLDVRFFSGHPDVSELPSAYKNAAAVKQQIKDYGLADIVEEVIPYGSIMAGDCLINAPWRRKKQQKRDQASSFEMR